MSGPSVDPSLGLNTTNIGPNKTNKNRKSNNNNNRPTVVRNKFGVRNIGLKTGRPIRRAWNIHQSKRNPVIDYKRFVDTIIGDIEKHIQFTPQYLTDLKKHKLQMDQDFPGRLSIACLFIPNILIWLISLLVELNLLLG